MVNITYTTVQELVLTSMPQQHNCFLYSCLCPFWAISEELSFTCRSMRVRKKRLSILEQADSVVHLMIKLMWPAKLSNVVTRRWISALVLQRLTHVKLSDAVIGYLQFLKATVLDIIERSTLRHGIVCAISFFVPSSIELASTQIFAERFKHE